MYLFMLSRGGDKHASFSIDNLSTALGRCTSLFFFSLRIPEGRVCVHVRNPVALFCRYKFAFDYHRTMLHAHPLQL